jgi:hypothetical protein
MLRSQHRVSHVQAVVSALPETIAGMRPAPLGAQSCPLHQDIGPDTPERVRRRHDVALRSNQTVARSQSARFLPREMRKLTRSHALPRNAADAAR